ncbi:hypothetical protein [Streptomyces sp. NPDC057257]|uniref:hypothetical protein n=1 Tax=Streptomyces sp. NPDC057257 TaxID=3346071 RepID=UPI00363EAE57
MAVPTGVETVTVSSGKPLTRPDGTYIKGRLIFTGPDLATIPEDDFTFGGAAVARLEDGAFTVALVANDASGINPSGGTYKVETDFTNAPNWPTRYILLPKASTSVVLSDVLIPDPVAGDYAVLADASTLLAKTQNLADLEDPTAARGNLDLGDSATRNVGTEEGTVAAGDDSRFTNRRPPTGPAGGDLSGTYPDPEVAAVNGVAVSGTPTTGQVLTATGAADAAWQDPQSGSLDGAVLTTGDQIIGGQKSFTEYPVGPGWDPGYDNQLARKAYVDRLAKKPWIFDITDPAYGAVGDAVVVHDGQVAIGVPTLNCNTSARFHAGLVGKPCLIQGAGTFGVTCFKTTFATFNSATSMGLADAPPTSITNAVVVFGTNNYAAIRAAAADAEAYLAAGHTVAEVYSPPGAYILDGPLDTSKSGNGLVPISPYPTTGVKTIPTFVGAVSGAGVRHWEQQVPQVGGSCWIGFGFYSSTSAQIADIGANGNPGIISGPNEGTANGLAYGASARFSNCMPVIRDMAFVLPHTAFGLQHGAFNLYGCANAHVENVSISTLGVVPGTDYVSPGTFGTGLSIAALMPAPGNNDLTIIRNLSIQGGFTYGLFFSEHTLIDRIMTLYCWAGLCPVGNYAGSVGAVHPMKVLSASIEQCTRQVYFIGVGSEGVGPRVDIDQLQTESGTPTFDGNSTAALAGAEGKIMLTGLFTRSGVSIAQASGIELIDGQAGRAITRKTADYTASPIDRTILMDTSGGPLTLTLPNADYNPVQYIAKNIGTGTLTVATSAGQLIYPAGTATGATTATVSAGNVLRVQATYNGTAWAWYAV